MCCSIQWFSASSRNIFDGRQRAKDNEDGRIDSILQFPSPVLSDIPSGSRLTNKKEFILDYEFPHDNALAPARNAIPDAVEQQNCCYGYCPFYQSRFHQKSNVHNLAEERSDDSQNCAVRILCSIGPLFRISFCVKYGKDNDVMVAKDKEDFIREPPEKGSTHGLVNERMLERISEDVC